MPGCETEVRDINLPEFRQKLVVTGFLSPGDSVSLINVTSNSSLYGDLSVMESVGNLTGYIDDGSGEVMLDTFSTGLTFDRNMGLKLDHKKMQINPGGSYRLIVMNDAGLRAEAITRVPPERTFSIEVDTTSIMASDPFSPEKRRIILRIAFSDIAGEENFYRVIAKGYGYHTPIENSQTFRFTRTIVVDKEFFTDKGIDGTGIIRLSEASMKYFYEVDSSFVVVHLYHTEKPYYLYHKSLRDYDDGKGPFAEPTPVYSNVEGGLGVFTSYTVDSLVVRLK